MACILASGPCCPGFDSQHCQKHFRGKIVDVPEAHHQRRLEESGEWRDRTHLVVLSSTRLVLDSGKLVLKKEMKEVIMTELGLKQTLRVKRALKVF